MSGAGEGLLGLALINHSERKLMKQLALLQAEQRKISGEKEPPLHR